MKKTTKITLLFLLTISCKAQSPVFDILDLHNINKEIQGAYHKDTNNLLNPFAGTYLYTNGNTSLKVVLQKKTMSSMNSFYFEDLLIGEFQYIENGIEKANSLNKLSINYTDQSTNHCIAGNLVITLGSPGCDECSPNEKALRLGIKDSASKCYGYFIVRKVTVNSQQAIKIAIGWEPRIHNEGEPMPADASIPPGDYTLIKQ